VRFRCVAVCSLNCVDLSTPLTANPRGTPGFRDSDQPLDRDERPDLATRGLQLKSRSVLEIVQTAPDAGV